jgi:lysophospholipase L1-like esterase
MNFQEKQSEWSRYPLFLAVVIACLLPCHDARAKDVGGPLRLTLPAEFHAVVGDEMRIYFDNIVLTETPESYRFAVKCDLGHAGQRHWKVEPVADDIGKHELKVTVANADGTVLARATTTIEVVAADAGADRAIRLLIVGDSLTHATTYPNEIARLLSRPGNPDWKMLGTHRPAKAAAGVAHEGYGGWTWQRFATHHEPDPDGTYRKRSSPFVYLGADGKAGLDVKRYLAEECGGQAPDFCVFMLGINDCFSADPDDMAAIDARIDTMMKHADTLLAAFHQAAPNAELAICLTTPPNARAEAFEANYHGSYHRWGWKRIQHRLARRQIERYSARENERYHIVPTQLNLDPIDGYPVNNGVHPNESGYREIGASIYAWLKSRL